MEKCIVAILTCQPGKKAEALELLKTLAAESRAEKGNIQYELTQNTTDEESFFILERWQSDEAIAFHGNTPHFTSFLSQKDQIFANTVIHVLNPVAL